MEIFEKVLEMDHNEPLPQTTHIEFVKVVEARRSIRVFDPTPIPEDIVRECLRLALLAPNSSNLQPWEFFWVRSQEKKEDLIAACLSQPAASTAAELIVCVARTDTWRENRRRMLAFFEEQRAKGVRVPKGATDYYEKIVPMAYTQGYFGTIGLLKKLVLFVMGFFKPTPREPAGLADLRVWAVKSASLAAENLMLAFRAFGYDTCPMEGMDSKRVKRVIGAGRGSEVVMVISAGKRRPEGVYGPQVRFDSKFFVKEI